MSFTIQSRWLALCQGLGVNLTVAQAVYADVRARYGENGRYYHTLTHIQRVLQDVNWLYPDAPPTLHCAAWFHDVVYDPRRHDNEARSAAYATDALAAMGLSSLNGRVAQLILCTQTHQPPPDDREGQTLVDADLAILGTAAAAYDQYAAAIRQEYGFVPEDVYGNGRWRVLQGFAERPCIYHTKPAFHAWEALARANMQREQAQLAASMRKTG